MTRSLFSTKRVGGFSLALVSGALLTTEAAAAPSARLVYLRNPGAESCPGEENIRAAVAARLGYDPFFPSAPATMFVELGKTKGGFSARIKLVDDQNTVRGTRDLVHRGERCDEIVDAVALSVSIAIDPESLVRKAPAEAPPAPPPQPVVAADPPVPDRPAPTPEPPPPVDEARAADRVRGELGAFGALWVGAAPAPNASVSAAFRGRLANVSLAAEGRLDAAASMREGAGEIFTNLAGGALVPCFHTARASVTSLALCGEAFLGVFRAGSSGVANARTDSEVLATVGPRVGLELPLGNSLTLSGHLGAAVALGRKSVALGGRDVWETPPLAAGVAIGLRAKVF